MYGAVRVVIGWFQSDQNPNRSRLKLKLSGFRLPRLPAVDNPWGHDSYSPSETNSQPVSAAYSVSLLHSACFHNRIPPFDATHIIPPPMNELDKVGPVIPKVVLVLDILVAVKDIFKQRLAFPSSYNPHRGCRYRSIL